jgi:hypothetical protein
MRGVLSRESAKARRRWPPPQSCADQLECRQNPSGLQPFHFILLHSHARQSCCLAFERFSSISVGARPSCRRRFTHPHTPSTKLSLRLEPVRNRISWRSAALLENPKRSSTDLVVGQLGTRRRRHRKPRPFIHQGWAALATRCVRWGGSVSSARRLFLCSAVALVRLCCPILIFFSQLTFQSSDRRRSAWTRRTTLRFASRCRGSWHHQVDHAGNASDKPPTGPHR